MSFFKNIYIYVFDMKLSELSEIRGGLLQLDLSVTGAYHYFVNAAGIHSKAFISR